MEYNFTSFSDRRSGTHHTFGDNWLGTEIRFHRQTQRLPHDGLQLVLQDTVCQYGKWVGRGDHSFTFGTSENLAHFNFDFNFTQFLIGRPDASGFDESQLLALAFSHAVHGRLQFAGEFYGETQLNKTTPGFASSLWALSHTVVPRLVIDGGLEAGLTSGGPRRHAFVGATYSIANFYRARRKQSSSPSD